MEHDFEGICVSCDDDEFGDTSVKSFGGLVGSLFDLFEGSALAD